MHRDSDANVTAVVVIAEAALRRSAWQALLAQQPAVDVAATAAGPAEMTAETLENGSVAIFVDGAGLGPDAASQIVAAAAGAGVLWLLEEVELETVASLLRAGVMGCLPTDASVAELDRALVAVARGEIALPASIASRALATLARSPAPDGRGDELTAREHEVVDLLARGLTNKDIAQTLFLSVRTVEAHLRSVYAKLELRSRTEAVLWAIERRRKDDRG